MNFLLSSHCTVEAERQIPGGHNENEKSCRSANQPNESPGWQHILNMFEFLVPLAKTNIDKLPVLGVLLAKSVYVSLPTVNSVATRIKYVQFSAFFLAT